jgi:hypothetical protein
MVMARFAVSAQDCYPATPARYFGKEIIKFVSGSARFQYASSSWDSN